MARTTNEVTNAPRETASMMRIVSIAVALLTTYSELFPQSFCDLDPRALTSIGEDDVEFGQITGGGFVNDTVLIVGDGMGRVVHTFSIRGRLIRSAGRTGSGPGEFRGIHKIWVIGDTAFVLDKNLGRFTLVSETGIVGSFQTGDAIGGGTAVRVLLPGRRAVSGTVLNARPRGRKGAELWLDSVRLEMSVGKRQTRLGDFLAASRLIDVSKAFWVVDAPFSPSLSVTAVKNSFFVNDGSGLIRRFTYDGKLNGTIRIPWKPERLDDSSYKAWIDYHFELWRKHDQTIVRRLFDPVKKRSQMPIIGSIVGAGDLLWIHQYRPPFDDRELQLIAVTIDGSRVVDTRIPAHSRVLAATRRHVALLKRDSDGVETISVHRIRCDS
jgi:hypothetical protein